jgi:hypothetical protein
MHGVGRFIVELENGLFVESSHVVSRVAGGVGNTTREGFCEEVHWFMER